VRFSDTLVQLICPTEMHFWAKSNATPLMRPAHCISYVVLSGLKFSFKAAESVRILTAMITTFWHL